MRRTLLGLGLAAIGALGAAAEARAQVPGESVVYETVTPGSRTITYGERYVVRRKPFKTVIKERPARYVTTTPPVVRETRVIRPAPVIQQRVIQSEPVIQTRYYSPYP